MRARPAGEGETLKSLDNQDLKLDGTMLVIADKDKPAALAGVRNCQEEGLKVGLGSLNAPGAGFFPAMVGGILSLLSISLLAISFF